MRNLMLATVVGLCLVALACGGATAPSETATAPDVATQEMGQTEGGASIQEASQTVDAERHDVVYVCNCGPACDCKSVATKPGTCSCGKELAWAHVVKIEGDEALLCTCDEGCTCAIDANDPTKCGCGKELRRISLAGTGLYYCNCGGSCTCNYVSSEPGTCRCGMELKKAA